jgi:chromosome segregation ATPase
MRKVNGRVMLAAGAFAVGGVTAVLAQGSRPQSDDVLSQLLIEVRGLRAAMEQMASAGPRVQLALGRVQLQEQRIVNQVRRLDAVKANLAAVENEARQTEGRLRPLEQALRDHPNAELRTEIEPEVGRLKRELSDKRAQAQALGNEEAVLAQDIAAEQNRWSDFNRLLEELERALARR